MSSIWTVRRSATDAKVTGLCGGVADHWRIDPVLVRVAFVLLALSGGVGLVLYAAGWLLIPVEGRAQAPVDDLLGGGARRWPKEVWLTLVVVACLVVFAVFGSLSPFGVGPAILLACIWYFGFYKNRQRHAQPPHDPAAVAPPTPSTSTPQFLSQAGPATAFTVAAEAWRRRIEEHVQQSTRAGAATATPANWPAPPTAPYPAELREPDPEEQARAAFLATPDPVGLYSPAPTPTDVLPVRRGDRLSARRLRLAGLAVLGLALAALGFLDGRAFAVPAAAYAATALLVVGLTLLAATWFGRARGLLPLGLLLVPVVLATSVAGQVDAPHDWGTPSKSYTQISMLPTAGDQLESGQLEVDLHALPVTRDVTYTAHVDNGRLEVRVPADVDVAVRYRVGLGVVQPYDGEPLTGQNLQGTLPADPADPADPAASRPTLTLDVSVDLGQLEVRR